jgi:hypothetical protein
MLVKSLWQKDKKKIKQKQEQLSINIIYKGQYLGLPFPQALLTLDLIQHQLYSESTRVMVHQPSQSIRKSEFKVGSSKTCKMEN